MSIKIGDLVAVRTDEIEVVQSLPYVQSIEPVIVKIRKGLIFEVVAVFESTKSVRIVPVNYPVSEEFIIISEIDKLYKCGRAVEYLYNSKKKT